VDYIIYIKIDAFLTLELFILLFAAMQSDILPHAASSDSPKKSYAQQLTGSPTIAKYAAISAKVRFCM